MILRAPLWAHVVGVPASLLAGFAHPGLTLLDTSILWLVLLFLVALLGRLWLAAGCLVIVAITLSAISHAKMSILAEPLVPADRAFVSSPEFLLSMVSTTELALSVGALVLVGGCFVFTGRALSRRHPRLAHEASPRLRRRIAAARIGILVSTAALLMSTTAFNESGNPWRRLYDGAGAAWVPYSQAMNYRANGFVGGALYNMPIVPMAEPAGYSEGTMADVAAKYADRARERNIGRDGNALRDVNVVLVLSESFADPARLRGVSLGRDPIPLTRARIADSWGGEALTNFYGTGTSSMEFQALTGQNLALFNPQIVAPYQDFLADVDTYPSAVGWFARQGHTAIAVHPYSTEMYRRSTVYPMLGFEEFVHDENMQEQDRVEDNTYISDESAFAEVEYQMQTHDEPVLVNLVTMQNHVPMADWYADPIPVTGDVTEAEAREISGDARGLEISDAALDRFLDRLATADEDTIVVFYGDHYPGIYGDAVLAENPGIAKQVTPLLIWSNRDSTARPLPLTSSDAFLPYVFDLANQTLPPYYELLTEVREEIGALSPGHIVTPDGREITESDLTPAQRELLDDYRLVQYDFSVGGRYAVDEMWYPMPD